MAEIQKIAAGHKERAWGAARRAGYANAEPSRLAKLDESVAELTAQLMARSVTRAEDRQAGYAAAVRLVASVFSANQVTLLLPESAASEPAQPAEGNNGDKRAEFDPPSTSIYRPAATWGRLARDASPEAADSKVAAKGALEFDLALAPPLHAALEAGLACQATGDRPLIEANPLWDAPRRDGHWQAASRRLLLPCVGPPEAEGGRLLGVLVIESGLGGRDWTTRFIVRASTAATSLATFLERARLSRALSEIRAERMRAARLEALGETARSVAHDFNNLLTAIQGYADLADLEMLENAAGRESLLEIQGAASRAARLVDEILRCGQAISDEGERGVSAAPLIEPHEPLDLAESLAELSGLIAQIAGLEIEVRMDVEADLPRVRVGRDELDRMVLNLVANARDAISETERRGLIEIKASVERTDEASGLFDACRKFVRLSLSDNGSGLRERARERLFERGFTTKPLGRGHGLGLSGAAELMRACGGRIRVARPTKSDGQVGTAFHLDFPIG